MIGGRRGRISQHEIVFIRNVSTERQSSHSRWPYVPMHIKGALNVLSGYGLASMKSGANVVERMMGESEGKECEMGWIKHVICTYD